MKRLTPKFIHNVVTDTYRVLHDLPYGTEIRFSELMDKCYHLVDEYQIEKQGAWVCEYKHFSIYQMDILQKLRSHFSGYVYEKGEFLLDGYQYAGLKCGLDTPWYVRKYEELVNEFSLSEVLYLNNSEVSYREIITEHNEKRRLIEIPPKTELPKTRPSYYGDYLSVVEGVGHITYSDYGYYCSQYSNRKYLLANIQRYNAEKGCSLIVNDIEYKDKRNWWRVKNNSKKPLLLYVVHRGDKTTE